MNRIMCKNLYFLRRSKGLSQKDFCDDIYLKTNYEISRQKYAAIEVGNNEPDLEFIIRVSEYYQITLDELILSQILK